MFPIYKEIASNCWLCFPTFPQPSILDKKGLETKLFELKVDSKLKMNHDLQGQ